MLITKSEAVAVFVFPATSLATPANTESRRIPAVPPAPVALTTVNTTEAKGEVVNAVWVIAQPVDSIFLVISEISIPLTVSLKVAVIWFVKAGAAWVAVLFPPVRICEEVNVTVGRVVSICTPASAVEAPVVVPPRV